MMTLISYLICSLFLHTAFASIKSDCLQKHNFYRRKHGVPHLQYSDDLAEEAQKLAQDVLTTAAESKTNVKMSSGTYDLNFFSATWTTPRTISDAVENWYNEGNSYNYNDPQISTSNNHFVEILWKSHERIGCGFAVDEDLGGNNVRTVVVAIYDPAGTRVDIEDFTKNILPPN